MRLAAIALVVSIAAINAPGGVVAGEIATGSIVGVVFDDYDGDGVQDEGEPGLPDKGLGLDGGAGNRHLRRTDVDGSFTFNQLRPGGYLLEVVLPERIGVCSTTAFSFSPLQIAWCLNLEFPWHSTPGPVSIMVEADFQHKVELAAQPADVAVISGIALLEDDRAPEGTTIEVRVGDKECGRTETAPGVDLNFDLIVLGAREREGCALPGEAVHFVVGGVPAAEMMDYQPFSQRLRRNYQIQHLVAMENYAWYWFSGPIGELPQGTVHVEAVIDTVVCGVTQISPPYYSGVAGFSKLIVPSEEVGPGCGRPDADVSFYVDGVLSQTSVEWQPGLSHIALAMAGDANCDLTSNALDAILVLQLAADLLSDVPCADWIDVHGDGSVDSRDAALILQFAAGILTDL